jgi:hypothetical protein
MLKSPSLVLGVLVAGAALAGAQGRIAVRSEPRPDQIIHVATTHELSITSHVDAPAGEPLPAQIVTKSVLGYTQSNGRFDEHGRMESQLTIDRIGSERTINEITKADGSISQFVGRSLVAVFDRAGKLVDVKVPQELQHTSGNLTQLVAAVYATSNILPDTAMAIGETATISSDIPLRLPGNTTTAPYHTRTFITLRAVEQGVRDRIARVEQRVESVAATDHLTVNGTGTIDVNLDRGFVTASTLEWTVTGAFPSTGQAPAADRSPVRLKVKVTVTANE